MRATDTEIVVVDLETTGTVAGHPSEPWQIGMVLFRHGRIEPEASFSSFLHVGSRPFHPKAPGRHREHRRAIAEAPTLYELWPEILGWCSDRPLAAHNIATEKNLLRRQAPIHRLGPWIDTLKLTRVAYPDLGSHHLPDLLTQLRLIDRVRAHCPEGAPHDALFDAFGCAVLLEHLLRLPGWREASLRALMRAHPGRYHHQLARRVIRRTPKR